MRHQSGFTSLNIFRVKVTDLSLFKQLGQRMRPAEAPGNVCSPPYDGCSMLDVFGATYLFGRHVVQWSRLEIWFFDLELPSGYD